MVLYIVLSPQKEFLDSVVIQEPLGSSNHNQLHFNINIKSDKTNVKQCRRDFRKGNYKDDIAIFAPSAFVLQEALTILQEEANLVGMQISWPKTKLMAITPKPTNHLPLKICNNEVLFVDSFTYLGSLITNDGSSSRNITYRIAKAASAMCRLSNPLFRQHRISIRTKINMYRALVVSVLLYGSEAWATTLADRRRLDLFDMCCKWRLLRVFWQQHISNQSIRERTRQPTE